jgi:hypothetical protein
MTNEILNSEDSCPVGLSILRQQLLNEIEKRIVLPSKLDLVTMIEVERNKTSSKMSSGEVTDIVLGKFADFDQGEEESRIIATLGEIVILVAGVEESIPDKKAEELATALNPFIIKIANGEFNERVGDGVVVSQEFNEQVEKFKKKFGEYGFGYIEE